MSSKTVRLDYVLIQFVQMQVICTYLKLCDPNLFYGFPPKKIQKKKIEETIS